MSTHNICFHGGIRNIYLDTPSFELCPSFCSSEMPHQGDSNKNSSNMFPWRNMRKHADSHEYIHTIYTTTSL